MKAIKIPSILSSVIITALTGIDSMEFTLLPVCPYCGGSVKFHDIRMKRFATVIEDDHKRIISVKVHRFYCRECGKLGYAKAPFYPDTKFGAPVTDLCMTISREHPFNHTARILETIGVVVDRGTIRNFSGREFPEVSYAKIYGLPIPLSLCYLSDLFSKTRINYSVSEEEVLEVCGFPVNRT